MFSFYVLQISVIDVQNRDIDSNPSFFKDLEVEGIYTCLILFGECRHHLSKKPGLVELYSIAGSLNCRHSSNCWRRTTGDFFQKVGLCIRDYIKYIKVMLSSYVGISELTIIYN